MDRSVSSVTWLGLLALVAGMALSDPAHAHNPTISATTLCPPGGGPLVIQYTSTSWAIGPGGANTQIDILVNGVKVGQGAYTPPDYSFSGSALAPTGTSATVTAVAVGQWEADPVNGQSASQVVVYPTTPCAPPALGRFTGGFILGSGASRITGGLTIHCDLALSNNLEINWGRGEKFHMAEHLQTIVCSDDPAIVQRPPSAPVDTIVGIGTGRFNNQAGYTVLFTLVDSGEPGRGADEVGLYVYETANPTNVVLNTTQQSTTGGNIQAHYDQPHKQK
jgi:hypothetical protein